MRSTTAEKSKEMLAISGSAAFFSQYPVLMQKVFNIPTNISSAGFAVVAGLGLALYTPAGKWSEKFGSVRVLRVALGIRWVAYIGLLGLSFLHLGLQYFLPLLGFAFVVCAWSIISVSGTTLAA